MSLFISLEGPDGSGKSTQAQKLAAALRSRGFQVTETREPGGTSLGDRIRSLLFDADAPEKTALAVAMLYATSRAQLVHDVIRPRLERGDIVIADRYADSTLAYQSFGQGLNLDEMRSLVHLATGGLTPHLTLYIDISPSAGMRRLSGRHETNWLDRQSTSFHERVRDGYRSLMREDPARWHRIDGERPMDAVHCAILDSVEPALTKVARAK
ncbi:MAG: dTMP kinase [Chloroflexota bacterium]